MPTVESFETLVALSIDELQARSKKYVLTVTRLGQMREKETRSRPQAGKVMAAFKRVFTEKVKDGSIPEGTSFTEYFKIATGKAPSGRVEQCANTFNSFVVSNLITEQDYDFCAADWIEKASAIVKAAKNNLGNNHVLDTANLLKSRPSDIAKKLNLIKAELRGQSNKVDENGDTLNLEHVIGFVKMATDKGYGADIATTLCTLIRENVKEWEEKPQRETFVACGKLMSVWAETIGEETINGWLSEAEKADAPIEIVSKPAEAETSQIVIEPKPVETVQIKSEPVLVEMAAPDFAKHAKSLFGKKLPEDKVAAAARMIETYHEVNKGLPETAEELNAFAEQALTAA